MSHNPQSLPDEGFSIPQIQALGCFSAGLTIAETSREIDVSRQTLYNWRNDPKFAAACATSRQCYANELREYMLALSRKALNRLEAILDDPKAPHSVALKAALAVLNRPQFPEPGWSLPANINTAKQDRIQETSLAIEIDRKQAELENLQRKLMMGKIKAEAAAPPQAAAPTGQNLTPSQPVNPTAPPPQATPTQPPQPRQTQPTGQNLTSIHAVNARPTT